MSGDKAGTMVIVVDVSSNLPQRGLAAASIDALTKKIRESHRLHLTQHRIGQVAICSIDHRPVRNLQ